ncbi:hypothetical protein REIS_0484 [Rickettsia endosymbiont of Ixodes scapularis]|nr:hypothetical protein REIS_0484 [Rickettsia endosymbiont of Ixodes scapularis]
MFTKKQFSEFFATYKWLKLIPMIFLLYKLKFYYIRYYSSNLG